MSCNRIKEETYVAWPIVGHRRPYFNSSATIPDVDGRLLDRDAQTVLRTHHDRSSSAPARAQTRLLARKVSWGVKTLDT